MRIDSLAMRPVAVIVALVMMAFLLPLAEAAFATHGDRTLDVTPETAVRPTGETQRLTATVSSDAGPGAINIDFELETGNNNPEGNTPQFPDETCSIPTGENSCFVDVTGEDAGTDRWRVWVDHDGLDSTTEADSTEQQATDEEQPALANGEGDECNPPLVPGAPSEEPDCTDVVTITWQGRVDPASVDCDDEQGPDTERALNPSGGGEASSEDTICRVFDESGQPINDADPGTSGVQSTRIYGENEGGPNDPDNGISYDSPDYQCDTGTNPASNQCTIEVPGGELEEGTAEVCFWVVGRDDENATAAGTANCADEPTGEAQNEATKADGANDLADQTEVTWEARAATSVDVEPETATIVLGGERQATATVYDQFGQQYSAENSTVMFEFFALSPTDATREDSDGNSPQTPDDSCTTNNSPTCTFSYTQATTAGRDLLCAWIGAAPAMTQDAHNDRGRCAGEGRVDADDDEAGPDAPEPNSDRRDVISTVWTNDPPATIVECTPETRSGLVRSRHTIRCTATTGEPDAKIANTEIDIEATGANDPDNGDSKSSPDFWCKTNGQGVCTVNHGGGRGTRQAGPTTYTAWIDADYHNSSVEADVTEGRNEANTAGGTPEPDNTDVVAHRWLSGDRDVSLNAPNNAERGSRITLAGRVNARAGNVCEDDQTLKLKVKNPDDKRFRTIRRSRTDDDGRYEFTVRVWKDKIFKVVVLRSGGCVWSSSSNEPVNVT